MNRQQERQPFVVLTEVQNQVKYPEVLYLFWGIIAALKEEVKWGRTTHRQQALEDKLVWLAPKFQEKYCMGNQQLV